MTPKNKDDNGVRTTTHHRGNTTVLHVDYKIPTVSVRPSGAVYCDWQPYLDDADKLRTLAAVLIKAAEIAEERTAQL